MFKLIFTLIIFFTGVCQAGPVRLSDLQDAQKPTPTTSGQASTQQDVFILRNGQIVTPGPGVICADGGSFCQVDEIVASDHDGLHWRPIILTTSLVAIGTTIYFIRRHREATARIVVTPTDTANPHRDVSSRLSTTGEVPEPITILLLATGLGIGIAGAWRRQKLRARRAN